MSNPPHGSEWNAKSESWLLGGGNRTFPHHNWFISASSETRSATKSKVYLKHQTMLDFLRWAATLIYLGFFFFFFALNVQILINKRWARKKIMSFLSAKFKNLVIRSGFLSCLQQFYHLPNVKLWEIKSLIEIMLFNYVSDVNQGIMKMQENNFYYIMMHHSLTV